MSFSNSRVLCIESYLDSCELISRLLFVEKHDLDFTVTHSPNRALALVAERRFDLYIVSGRLPEMPGVEFCRRLRKADPHTPILFLTDKTRAAECRVALAAGVDDYLILPAAPERLTARVLALLGRAALPAAASALAAGAAPLAAGL